MLVLSRKRDEKVIIRDQSGQVVMTIMVNDIRGDKVRIGIDAGQEFQIHRKEVDDAIRRHAAENTTSIPLHCSGGTPTEGPV